MQTEVLSMAKNRSQDSWVAALGVDDRRLYGLFKDATLHERSGDQGKRALQFAHLLRINQFCDAMMRRDDQGYSAGARFFMAAVNDGSLERAEISHLLTMMAGSFYEMLGEKHDEPLREQEVAFFGRFIRHLLPELPQTVLEWAEDMNVDDPSRDLSSQPTALIRGVLLSQDIVQPRCRRFWEMAAESERFPLRIFSDPCDPRDGCVFSSYHLRSFGALFSLVSERTLVKFAGHMRKHAVRTCLMQPIGNGEWMTVTCPAFPREKYVAFSSIVGYVAAPDRRQKVADLLGVTVIG
jgi:hypothetical protein